MTVQVLDASAAVEDLLQSARGRWVRARLDWSEGVWVPEHFYAEVTGTIRGFEQQGTVDAARAGRMLAQLARLPLVVLARHLGVELVTCDARLQRAPGVSISVVTPPGP